MKDNYQVSQGVRKLEDSEASVLNLSDSELTERIEMLHEIFTSPDKESINDFFRFVDKKCKKDGITQEDIDEHLFRQIHPKLFPDIMNTGVKR